MEDRGMRMEGRVREARRRKMCEQRKERQTEEKEG